LRFLLGEAGQNLGIYRGHGRARHRCSSPPANHDEIGRVDNDAAALLHLFAERAAAAQPKPCLVDAGGEPRLPFHAGARQQLAVVRLAEEEVRA